MCENLPKEFLPPNGFEEWLAKKVFENKYLYFSKNTDGGYTGYCSCGAEGISISSPRTGKYGVCPVCKEKVRYKSTKYPRAEERKITAYLQETSNGWVQRLFVAYKFTYYAVKGTTGTTYTIHTYEDQRDYIGRDGNYRKFHENCICSNGKTVKEWKNGKAHKHGMGWKGWYSEECRIMTYPYNIKDIFKGSEYRYSALTEAAEHMQLNPFWYLISYSRMPQLEYVVKFGLYTLAEEMFDIDHGFIRNNSPIRFHGKTLKELCGLETKADIAFAAEHNLSARAIQAYTFVKHWKEKEPISEALDFMVRLTDRAGKDFQYSFISNEKLFRYYITQKSVYSLSNFLSDYRDYIEAAIYLKMNADDTKVKTPKDLRYCHDICLARKAEVEILTQKLSFKKLYKKYTKIFAYEDSKYTILVPKTPEAIQAEGKAQGHCVGSYIERVEKGTCIILFLRKTKAPEKPFCTVELSSKYRLIQARIKGNHPTTKEAEKWLNKYVDRIQKQGVV